MLHNASILLLLLIFTETSETELSLRGMEQGGPATNDRLMEQFRLLHEEAEKFLQDSGCTTQSLLICAMNINHVKCSVNSSTLKELESASSVCDVFHVLKKHILRSFLHYEVMKHIIMKLCSECKDLQMSLSSYEASYEQFIRTPVHKSCVCREERFEVLSGADSEDTTDLVITADDDNTSFAYILHLESIIAKAFRCSKLVLHIHYIELQPPHLTLVYGIPCFIVDSIFPLTLEEWDMLRSHSISEIRCAECHYMLDDKGSALEIVHVLLVTTLLLTCSSYWCSHGIC